MKGIIVAYYKDLYRNKIHFFLFNGEIKKITEEYDLTYDLKDLNKVYNDSRSYNELIEEYQQSGITKNFFLMEYETDIINNNGYLIEP